MIGQKVRKVDGTELVTGKAKFTGDYQIPGLLHGVERRAGVPTGKIIGIDKKPTLSVPGVLAVLTAEDIPGANIIGIFPPFDQPLLPEKDFRYAGESIALVIGESKRAAAEGARALKVDIEKYPPILTIDEALAAGARKIHEQGNVTFSKKLIKGDTAAGFSEADVIIEKTYQTSFQEHAYLEPEVVCAVPESDNRITLYASCQSPFHIRGHVASALGVPASRVRVVQAFTGGSFGGKDDVATEIGSLAAIAARKLSRPVLIAHDREESIIGSNLRHASRIRYKTGAKQDGTITAKEINIELDGGAYASESPFVTMKALIHAAGPYNIPNITITSTAIYTNKTYCGAFRGFGVPQVTFASESQMDELAEKLHMNPLDLRRKNGLKAGDPTATNQIFESSVGLLETIDAIAAVDGPQLSDTKNTTRDKGRYVYGTGYATLLQGISNGAEGVDVVGASVQMSQDGSVLVGVGLTEMGQGARTVYAQIASEVLGVSIANITVRLVDTDTVHDSGPTVASRSTTVGGMAVMKASENVKKSLVSMAGLMLNTKEDNIVIKDDFAVLKPNDDVRIPLREVATAAYWTGFPLMDLYFSKAPAADFDHETHQGNIYIAYNYGTHRMDVCIDTYTGVVNVLGHYACHDVGKVINQLGLEGQVEGASLIGYGLAHLERVEYQEGMILNSNFADYAVPSIKDRLPTETLVVEDPNHTGPFGAKGVGEPPGSGAAAAFANAVADALGTRFYALPITRENILQAVRGRAAEDSRDKKSGGKGQ